MEILDKCLLKKGIISRISDLFLLNLWPLDVFLNLWVYKINIFFILYLIKFCPVVIFLQQ